MNLTTLLKCSNVLEWCIPVDWVRSAHIYAVLEEEWCLVLGLDTLHFWTHGCQSILQNWAPHWAPRSVTSISLYQLVLLDALQLAAGATGLFSGGDISCLWVFCSCTGPKGESYTQLEGWQLVSWVAITVIWNRVHSGGYSHQRTQTSSFSCKAY